jgi:hypothetical protein
MRRILTWAAAAAILAHPAIGWCQSADPKPSQESQSQTSGQTTGTTSSATTTTITASPAPPQESLAEAARKAREAKKDETKPVKVFTNENIPASGGISTVGKEPPSADAAADGTVAKAGPADEKTWREKFAALRAKLARDQEDLTVMQRELGVLDLQNYSDPVKAMQQQLTREDINKKTADIDAKTQAIKADQQAIDDAEDALRKAGGDSGWSR